MSARKKVNQSSPRAFACAAASRVAGAVCFDAADDAKPPSTRAIEPTAVKLQCERDSLNLRRRRGFTASVFGRMPRAIGLPSHYPPAPRTGYAGQRRRRSCLLQVRVSKRGNFEKSRCEFHRNSVYGRQDFREKAGFQNKFHARWRNGTFTRGLPLAAHGGARCSSPRSIWSFIPTSRFVRSRRRRKSWPPAVISIARPRNCCIGSKALDAGRGRRRRQGLSRLVRSGRPAAGPAGGRRARLNETRPSLTVASLGGG